MKLLLISDAWEPQTNGVVTTYKNIIQHLTKQQMQIEVIHPGLFKTVPCPGYSEIKLAINTWQVSKKIQQSKTDCIHIATEGPLGLAARNYLVKNNIKFTTSFHTRFPEYINKRLPFVPIKLGYSFMHWFHKHSKAILVTTKSMRDDLAQHQFQDMVVWGRGVNTDLFKPSTKTINNAENPTFMYVGRVAVEKNIEAFLSLQLPGRKVVVGDGPSRKSLEKQYPEAEFVGYKFGEALAEQYARADVFVFPSKTDTFGLVMLEAMACGTPVAAYPVPGPIDVVQENITGILSDNLADAALQALNLRRQNCRDYAIENSWETCATIFKDNLVSA